METSIPTSLSYLQDSYSFESFAVVLQLIELDEGICEIVLDTTIFYPQGGGQPSDFGRVVVNEVWFNVKKVRFDNGLVYHIGTFENGLFNVGDKVQLQVDKSNRIENCKNHTAGHLVDVAMINCGYDFKPTKGYHFKDSPYVEYDGVIPAEERENAKNTLEKEANRLIGLGAEISSFIVEDPSLLSEHCNFVPDYIPEGKPIRVVKVAGVGCPCGGTHIKKLSELSSFNITKIKLKGGKTRINYRAN